MNKKWKGILAWGFEAPPPGRKESFLRDAPLRPVNSLAFVRVQAAYIRKWVWALSAVLFLAALAGSLVLERDIFWTASALLPVLALSLVTESGRSAQYGMAELEQASRFSLKSVLLARMGILGLENLALIVLLVPLALRNNDMGVIQAGMYLSVPYLLTSFLGLAVIRRAQGSQSTYICMGIAFFVGLGNNLFHQRHPMLYEKNSLGWWLMAGGVLAAGVIYQYGRMIRQREVSVWSF